MSENGREEGDMTPREDRSKHAGGSAASRYAAAALGSPRSWTHSLDAYRIRRWVAVALLLLGLLGLAACGESIVGDDPDTGVAALVLRGPIHPVVQGDEPDEAPVEGARLEIEDVTGAGRVTVATGPDGRVRVLLRPGRYAVAVRSCPGALTLPGEVDVPVVDGEVAELILLCDTGIR